MSDATEHRIVFVGGLHRSGTTPVGRWLTEHPMVSGLEGTGKWEDEGQHVQSVLPPAIDEGGPGRFAFSTTGRLTEDHPVQDDAAEALFESWRPFWDLSKPVLVEKSPPNLIRMRLLRRLFPEAPFVIVVRHPAAVALATKKWSRTSLDSLLRHWLVAHENLVDDARTVGNVALVRYEDVMSAPAEEMDRLYAFLELPSHEHEWPVRGGLNEEYFAGWKSLKRPWRPVQRRVLERRYAGAFEPYGYHLDEPWVTAELAPEIERLRAPVRASAPSGRI